MRAGERSVRMVRQDWTGLTDIIVKIARIVERMDDNPTGGDNPLVVILDAGPVVAQGHVEVVDVDVLQEKY